MSVDCLPGAPRTRVDLSVNQVVQENDIVSAESPSHLEICVGVRAEEVAYRYQIVLPRKQSIRLSRGFGDSYCGQQPFPCAGGAILGVGLRSRVRVRIPMRSTKTPR